MTEAITRGTTASNLTAMSDAELIVATRAGDETAYAELYRRHVDSARAAGRSLAKSRADADDAVSDAFTRVLMAIKNGGGPQVAFRPYLLSAVRNAYFDRTRKDKRIDGNGEPPEQIDLRSLTASANEDDRQLVATAFASLPERWQMVLWHTEVEGMNPAEVAPLLGVAPNAVAALAYRAREGLRQAYLQAHLQRPTPLDCQESRPKLGAYVRDGLSMRDRRKVDEHLDDCERCTALLLELQEANAGLRAVMIPLVIGVPVAAYLAHLGVGAKGLWMLLRAPGKARYFAVGGSAAGAVTVAAVAGFALSGEEPRAIPPPAPIVVTTTARTVAPTEPVVIETVPPPLETIAPPVETVPPAIAPPPETVAPIVPIDPTTTTTTTIPFTDFPDFTTTTLFKVPIFTNPTTTTTTTTTTEPELTLPAPTTTRPPVLPNLTVEVTPRGLGINGVSAQVVAKVQVVGGDPGIGLTPIIRFTVPAGVSVSQSTSWKCSSTPSAIACAVPQPMRPGQSSSSTLTLAVPVLTTVPMPISVTAEAGPVVSSRVSPSVQFCPFNPGVGETVSFCERMNGGVAITGNSSMTCDTGGDAECVAAQSGTATPVGKNNRQNQPMVFVNDAAKGMYNASSATLTLPPGATVSRALLVWSGDPTSDPNSMDRTTVDLIAPSGTRTAITASRDTDVLIADRYTASADVTSLIAGSGIYTVADIAATESVDRFAGWQLLVAYRDASAPLRLVALVDRFQRIPPTPATIVLTGIPARSGTRFVGVALASSEGDHSIPETGSGDSVTLNATPHFADPLNPSEKFFASSAPAAGRSPAFTNLFGIDVDAVTFAVPAADTTLTLTLVTNGDAINLLGVGFAIDV